MLPLLAMVGKSSALSIWLLKCCKVKLCHCKSRVKSPDPSVNIAPLTLRNVSSICGVGGADELVVAVNAHRNGEDLPITVVRQGRELVLNARLR